MPFHANGGERIQELDGLRDDGFRKGGGKRGLAKKEEDEVVDGGAIG